MPQGDLGAPHESMTSNACRGANGERRHGLVSRVRLGRTTHGAPAVKRALLKFAVRYRKRGVVPTRGAPWDLWLAARVDVVVPPAVCPWQPGSLVSGRRGNPGRAVRVHQSPKQGSAVQRFTGWWQKWMRLTSLHNSPKSALPARLILTRFQTEIVRLEPAR